MIAATISSRKEPDTVWKFDCVFLCILNLFVSLNVYIYMNDDLSFFVFVIN